MKVLTESKEPDGTIKVKMCMCSGNVSKCKPSERPVKVFKSSESLEKFKKSFRL